MTAALVSLVTAAMVLAAFRLPALMMFRGMRPAFGLRRPIMVVRAPMARSMAVANPRAGNFTVGTNASTIASPSPPMPLPYPMARPQFWPFPGPLVPPMHYMPHKHNHELEPQPSYQLPALAPPHPQQKQLKNFYVSTPLPNIIRELKTFESVNNRPFYQPISKHYYGLTTTRPPNLFEADFHQVFRPLNNVNKYRKVQKPSLKKTFTESYNSLNVNQNNINEDNRYSMMYPMPRNYQNHRMEGIPHKQISTVRPITTEKTTPLTIPTTTSTTTKPVTKIWVKPTLKSNDNKYDLLDNNLLYNENRKQTNLIPTSTLRSIHKNTKNRFRFNKIRAKTTTTESTTVMTPAPIENYKPVKARIQSNKVHPNHKEQQPGSSERLMFDETKNLYYLVTVKSI